MGLSKFSLECNPHFMDQRVTIPGLDGLSKISGLVKDVVGFGVCLRV